MPEVSVIITARDAGRTIDAALNSVLTQTVIGGVEVLVVDDGSSDDTAARIRRYGAPVRYIAHAHRASVSAWNAGLESAAGQIVMLLRAQDVWMPRKIERQLEYLRSNPAAVLLDADALSSATPHAVLLDAADVAPVGGGPGVSWAPGRADARRLPIVSTVAIRRDVLSQAGFLNPELGIDAALAELWSRLGAQFTVAHQPVPLAIVRETPSDERPSPRAVGHRNLLQDTTYRRIRSAVTGALHAADAVMHSSRQPLRILFEAASPVSFAVFGPVLRRLEADRRLQFWFTSCDRSWTPSALFPAAGITERVVAPQSIRWSKFDAYINTDFWNMTWLPRRTRRVHFFHGVAGKYGLDAPVRIAPVVATYDRLMFPNRDRLRRYAEAGLVDGDSPRAALIGYPKVDCLVDGSLDRASTLGRIGVTTSRPTVLYAPTWSPYSSLNSVGPEVIAALAKLDVNVVVKLHDRSYDATTRGSGGVDWKQRLADVCQRHGAHLVQDADASPWLHAADLLVTDHSSVGFEFMLLDRPIVVIHSEQLLSNARVNPDKAAMLRQAAFVVEHPAAIGATVRTALDHPLEHSQIRRSVAEELFYCPGSATARAVQCMYTLLGLPEPTTADVESPAQNVPALVSLARSL